MELIVTDKTTGEKTPISVKHSGFHSDMSIPLVKSFISS